MASSLGGFQLAEATLAVANTASVETLSNEQLHVVAI